MCWILLFISLIHLAVKGNFVIIETEPDRNNSDITGNGEDFAQTSNWSRDWIQDLKTVFERLKTFKIAQGHKIGHRLHNLGTQFRISCKIELKQFSFSEQYYNILHFTKFGSEQSIIPAVWMQRNGKLLVSTAFAKEKNKWKVLDYQVNNGLVTRFDLLIQQRRVQKFWTTEHKFEVYVNGKKLWSPSFKNPEQRWFIDMYAGDPWYTPVNGWISNFKVESSDY